MAKKYDDASELDKRIIFQHFIGEADVVGDFAYLQDENWETDFTVWASLRTITGREFYAAGQETGEVTHNIKIRKRKWTRNAVTMRAVYKDKRFRFLTPPLDLDEEDRYQQLKVAEVWQ